jgi:hypothetical protein
MRRGDTLKLDLVEPEFTEQQLRKAHRAAAHRAVHAPKPRGIEARKRVVSTATAAGGGSGSGSACHSVACGDSCSSRTIRRHARALRGAFLRGLTGGAACFGCTRGGGGCTARSAVQHRTECSSHEHVPRAVARSGTQFSGLAGCRLYRPADTDAGICTSCGI